MSRSNLRLYKPDEYKKWKSNTYDGTNYKTGLTIEQEHLSLYVMKWD